MFSIPVGDWTKRSGSSKKRIFTSGRQTAAFADMHCNPSLNWNGHVVTRKPFAFLHTNGNVPSKKENNNNKRSHAATCKRRAIHQKAFRARDESLVRRHLHNVPRLRQLLFLPVEGQERGGEQSGRPVFDRVASRTQASPITRGAEQALNYSNLLAHESFASQNKIRQQSSLSGLRLGEVGRPRPPPPAHTDKHIDARAGVCVPSEKKRHKRLGLFLFCFFFLAASLSGEEIKAQVDQSSWRVDKPQGKERDGRSRSARHMEGFLNPLVLSIW